MAIATIVTRIDESDKRNFNAFCNSVGLNSSTAIKLFIKTVLRENCIPFLISKQSDPFYSQANQDYILKSVQELREGKGKPHDLIEVYDD